MKWVAQTCGCSVDVSMGQKRPRTCPCGNLFQRPGAGPKPRKAMKRGRGFAASPAQREKVKGTVCIACGREATEDGALVIDPAHVWPRGKGGCDHPDCVWGLCRLQRDGSGCHRLFDEGKMDLLPKVSENPEAFAVEITHPLLCHGVTLVELVRRLAGNRQELVWIEREAA